MDLRSRNRAREHAKHGWKCLEVFSVHRPNDRLMDCPCGWRGWIDKNAVEVKP